MKLNATKKIAYTAVFTTLALLCNLFSFNTGVKYFIVGFAAIPPFIAGVFLGPWCGAAVGFLGDLIAGIVHPLGPYNFLIGISCALFGLIPGLLFKMKWGNAYLKTVASFLLCLIVCTAGLNTFGLWLVYGYGKKTFWAYLIVRLPFQGVVSLINCALTMALCYALGKIKGTPLTPAFACFTTLRSTGKMAEDGQQKSPQEGAQEPSCAEKEGENLPLVNGVADDLSETLTEKLCSPLEVTVKTTGYGTYLYSFTAKLHQLSEEGKEYYNDLKNALLSYGLKSRISWANESLYAGRTTYAKFGIRGKALSLYLALNPADFADSKYYFEDASETAKYAAVPMRVRVKSARGLKWALELVAQMMEKAGKQQSVRAEEDFRLPYLPTSDLLRKRLIKLVKIAESGEEAFSEEGEEVTEVAASETEAVASETAFLPKSYLSKAIRLKRKERKKKNPHLWGKNHG